ncbi:MAG: chloride channel protein [Oscillospiraceae bacterium]|nr:chloride channel protein [Oscillospiraceae bacterium]MDD4368914.1 chloride channel protein [Oscillospiraceae bacterium]
MPPAHKPQPDPRQVVVNQITSLRQYSQRFRHSARRFATWVPVSLLIGLAAGSAGAVFAIAVRQLTQLRLTHGWLIALLPLLGLLIVFSYRKSGFTNPRGTNLVIDAIRSPQPIPLAMAPLIFISTCLTHLGGGSAGREGAALQLGGSLGYQVGQRFHMDERDLHLATMCGMAACFAALFGTPLTSVIFVMEIITVGIMYYSALVPCTIAALTGAALASWLGLKPTAYTVLSVPSLSLLPLLKVMLLAALCAAVSILFVYVMHHAEHYLQKWFPNPYLRVVIGGVAVLLLVWPFGRDYLGVGEAGIEAAFAGQAKPAAFILKLLFTAITLGSGFRGGEIVPTFFVGSTFGCWMGGLLGLDPSFGAAIGFLGCFCGVTNCPITTILLSIEVFGGQGIIYYFITAGLSYALSGYGGIYKMQQILYAKDKLLFKGPGGKTKASVSAKVPGQNQPDPSETAADSTSAPTAAPASSNET